MRVAAIQMTTSHDVEANLDAAGHHLADAARQGAVLAALPENFAFMGKDSGDKRKVAEPDGAGRIQDFLADTARRLNLWIVGGTVPVREAADGRVAAACLVYQSDGQRAARYDKMHLFDVDVPGSSESHRESAHTVPGREPRVVDTPVGKLGLAVCYDMRFPELFRALSRQGAEMFVVPSAFTVPTGRAHWESLLRARAIENLCGLMAPAQWGVHSNGRETFGDSVIIDHWGQVLARLPEGTGCVVADIDAAGRRGGADALPVTGASRSFNRSGMQEFERMSVAGSLPAGEPLAIARELILRPGGLDDARLDGALSQVMSSSIDAADLYFQLSREESWALEDGIVKEGSASIDQGVGVRALAGEKTGFAYSDEIMLHALDEASRAARAIAHARPGPQRAVRAAHGRPQSLSTRGSGVQLLAPARRWHGWNASTARPARSIRACSRSW